MNPQQQVHETLGLPLLGGLVCREIPLYAERYFLHTTDLSVPPVDFMALLTQFGGSRADEGAGGELRSILDAPLVNAAACRLCHSMALFRQH